MLCRLWQWKLDPLLHTLEAFQAELGKRILNLPKHFANLCPLVFLQWPTMRYRVLIWKLSFLHRLLNSPQSSMCFTHLKTRILGTMQVPGRGVPLKCNWIHPTGRRYMPQINQEGSQSCRFRLYMSGPRLLSIPVSMPCPEKYHGLSCGTWHVIEAFTGRGHWPCF